MTSRSSVRAVQIVRLVASAATLAVGGAAALALVITAAVTGNCFEGAGSNCDATTSPGWLDEAGPLLGGAVVLVPVLALAAWIALGTPTSHRLGRLRFCLLTALLVPSYVAVAAGTAAVADVIDLDTTLGIALAAVAAIGYMTAWFVLASRLASRRQVPAAAS